jgi:multidrug efflux pump subunit AcrB
VTWSVKHYFITVLIGFGIFAASIWSITLLPQGFLPAQDTARSLLAMELPPGSQLAYTEKVTEEIVARCASGRRSRASSSTAAGCRRARSRCAAPR